LFAKSFDGMIEKKPAAVVAADADLINFLRLNFEGFILISIIIQM
jgi:hypothetical protein